MFRGGCFFMETIITEYKVLTAVSYLIWPVSLVIVLTRLKKDRFLRFHGYQALFLGICGAVSYLAVGGLLMIIPILGALIFKLLVLLWVLLLIFLAYRCLRGEYFRVPLIYELGQGNME